MFLSFVKTFVIDLVFMYTNLRWYEKFTYVDYKEKTVDRSECEND